jgi:glycogen(starch) synthase
MRIAMVCDEFYPDVGGAPVYTTELVKALTNLGAAPSVLTHIHPGLPEEEEFEGVKVKRLEGFVMPRLNRSLSAGLAYRLHRCIKFGGFDVVHGQDLYSSMALQSIYSARKCKVPSVLTCHSVHKTTGPWKFLYKPLVFIMRRADRIIAPSNAAKGFCLALGIPSEKISVIAHGIDLSRFNSISGSSIRARLDLKSEPLIVTAIRLVKRKGPKYLVTAFSKVLQNLPDAKLAIAGEGSEAKNLRILIEKLGMKNSTFMLGALPPIQIAKLIAAADVFVLPSLFESFGIVLLEAMAAGTPIVCTRTEGALEIIQDNVNGVMVPPADDDALANAILEILNDRELAGKLRANGLKIVKEKFSLEKMAKQTLAIYEQVCETHA